ncbi:MAG: acyltransferase [Gammaproteobacteria bacterium]|nr:acyltransferase [Gammaproteobacteria bacterium]
MTPCVPGQRTKPPVIVSLQYLRALAALMVVYFHFKGQIPAYTAVINHDLLGGLHLSSGVDIFFVVSGFIMLVSSRSARPQTFLLQRIVRVVPLYWVLTALGALLACLWPELFRSTVLSSEYLVKSLLFIPYVNPGQHGAVVPLLVPGWSLNCEMFFYLIFSLMLYLPFTARLGANGLIFAVLVAVNLALLYPASYPALSFLTDVRLFEFWLGMAIAHFHLQGRPRLPAWLAVGLTALGFGALLSQVSLLPLLSDPALEAKLSTMLAAALIVLGAVGLERSTALPKSLLWLFLGDASYSIYLSHDFALGFARFTWLRFGPAGATLAQAAAFATFSMVAVLIGACLTYRLLERPLLAFLQSRLPRRRAALKEIPI